MRNAASGSGWCTIVPLDESLSQRSQSAAYQSDSSMPPACSASSRRKSGAGTARKFCTMSRSSASAGSTLPGGSGQRQRPSRAPRASTNHDGCTTSVASGTASSSARSARSRPCIHRSSWCRRQAYSPRANARPWLARTRAMIPSRSDGPQAAERVSMRHVRFLGSLVAENGLLWTFEWALSQLLKGMLGRVERSLESLERRRALPGLSGAAANRSIWDGYDWRRGGEEWTPSAEWKRSLTALIRERAPRQGTILEIGPGAGRWTEALQKLAGALTGVDVSRTSIQPRRRPLAGSDNVRYLLNDGRTLPDIPDDSIDFIWSFDTFVHVSPEDTAASAGAFRRTVRSGARRLVPDPDPGLPRPPHPPHLTTSFAAIRREPGKARRIQSASDSSPALSRIQRDPSRNGSFCTRSCE